MPSLRTRAHTRGQHGRGIVRLPHSIESQTAELSAERMNVASSDASERRSARTFRDRVLCARHARAGADLAEPGAERARAAGALGGRELALVARVAQAGGHGRSASCAVGNRVLHAGSARLRARGGLVGVGGALFAGALWCGELAREPGCAEAGADRGLANLAVGAAVCGTPGAARAEARGHAVGIGGAGCRGARGTDAGSGSACNGHATALLSWCGRRVPVPVVEGRRARTGALRCRVRHVLARADVRVHTRALGLARNAFDRAWALTRAGQGAT
jgi:hypothetical protein